eukprot:929268-Pleurochrysis_carterae.AAC.1
MQHQYPTTMSKLISIEDSRIQPVPYKLVPSLLAHIYYTMMHQLSIYIDADARRVGYGLPALLARAPRKPAASTAPPPPHPKRSGAGTKIGTSEPEPKVADSASCHTAGSSPREVNF